MPGSVPLLTTMQLGQLLLSARKEKRLTQADLAARMGLSQARISQMELHPESVTVQQLLTATAILDLELTLGLRQTVTQPCDW